MCVKAIRWFGALEACASASCVRRVAGWQSVQVTDQAGALFVLEYEMVPGSDGWQINGVTVRRSEDAAA